MRLASPNVYKGCNTAANKDMVTHFPVAQLMSLPQNILPLWVVVYSWGIFIQKSDRSFSHFLLHPEEVFFVCCVCWENPNLFSSVFVTLKRYWDYNYQNSYPARSCYYTWMVPYRMNKFRHCLALYSNIIKMEKTKKKQYFAFHTKNTFSSSLYIVSFRFAKRTILICTTLYKQNIFSVAVRIKWGVHENCMLCLEFLK